MKKKIELFGIVYIILVYLGLATSSQHIYNVTYYSSYYAGIICVIMCFVLYILKHNKKLPLKKKPIFIGRLFFAPVCVIFIYSMLLNLFNQVEFPGYVSRAFGLVAYAFLAILQAYLIYLYFGTKAVNYTFIAVALNYLTSIIIAFKQDGFSQFIGMLTDSSYVGSVLEMNEVGPIALLFVFYFWYQFRFQNSSRKMFVLKEIVCLIIIVLSAKRIVLLTGLIMILLFEFILLFKNKPKFIYRFIIVTSIAMVLLSLFFVWLIRSDVLFMLCEKFGINPMGRYQFWSGIRNEYYFSPTFLGRGSGYVSKWMDNNWSTLNIVGLHNSTGLHSDILKYYIELGFIGFCLYFYYQLIYVTKRIKTKLGFTSFAIYFVLIFQEYLIWFTDNISIFHNYQWIFYLLIFSLLSNNQDRRTSKVISKH